MTGREEFAEIPYDGDLPGSHRAQDLIAARLKKIPGCESVTVSSLKDEERIVIYTDGKKVPCADAVNKAIASVRSEFASKKGLKLGNVKFYDIRQAAATGAESGELTEEHGVDPRVVIKGLRGKLAQAEEEKKVAYDLCDKAGEEKAVLLKEKENLVKERDAFRIVAGTNSREVAELSTELALARKNQARPINSAYEANITYLAQVADKLGNIDDLQTKGKAYDKHQRELDNARKKLDSLGIDTKGKSLEQIISDVESICWQGLFEDKFDKAHPEEAEKYNTLIEKVGKLQGSMAKTDDPVTLEALSESINRAHEEKDKYQLKRIKVTDKDEKNMGKIKNTLDKLAEESKTNEVFYDIGKKLPIYVNMRKDEKGNSVIDVYLPQREGQNSMIGQKMGDALLMMRNTLTRYIGKVEAKVDDTTKLKMFRINLTNNPQNVKETRNIMGIVEGAVLRGYLGTGLRRMGVEPELISNFGYDFSEGYARAAGSKKAKGGARVSLEERQKRVCDFLGKYQTSTTGLMSEGLGLSACSLHEAVKSLKDEGRIEISGKKGRTPFYSLTKR